MNHIQLRLYDPLRAGNAPGLDVTDLYQKSWRRTIRRRGGFFLGTVDLAAADLTEREMNDLFTYGLLTEIRERGSGSETWRGALVKMEYRNGAQTTERDLMTMTNMVRVLYTRLFDSLLTNGSGEYGTWAAYGTATITQSTLHVTHGHYSIKIVVAGGVNGARCQATIAVAAGVAYTITGEVMGVRCLELMIEGVQFHPESIATPQGAIIMRNFVDQYLGLRAVA